MRPDHPAGWRYKAATHGVIGRCDEVPRNSLSIATCLPYPEFELALVSGEPNQRIASA